MFWNDPNLYSVAFKDFPTIPPAWGSPRYFNPYVNFTPYVNPMMFTPQFNPFQQTAQFNPFQQTAQFNPFQHTPQLPWFDRTMSPYGYNFPYRPFGL